ncbi:MAG: 3'(2'),5'-bisphosphate nucleotidase [Hyphomicrobiales bacterium]|nr:MAG: 3'(2'),5'-bisphosphate nucleotidase [Hyphomicrobiales bacterium]
MLATFEQLSLKAGAAIMHYYENGCETEFKDDQSPVTVADQAAEKIIVSVLREKYPDIPVVAEEEMSAGHDPEDFGSKKQSQRFFLVDPLDGTREFINQRSDFTVNIALIENGIPVAGIVYAPARGELYYGHGDTATYVKVEAYTPVSRQQIHVANKKTARVAVASRSHRTPETDEFLQMHKITDCVSVGSSLKFCILAKGEADIYPRFGRTMEWDTAAGDAILRAAGGMTFCTDGTVFPYGKRDQTHDAPFANPSFIAVASTVPGF